MNTLQIFFLNRSLVEKKSKTGFLNQKVLPFLYINVKWRAKFQKYRLHICDSDWLNFIHFSGYKYKIRLVSIVRKREDQALISISTILKFSALNERRYLPHMYIVHRFESSMYSLNGSCVEDMKSPKEDYEIRK